MAKIILNSMLYDREQYCKSVRPIAFLLQQSECDNMLYGGQECNNARERALWN